MAKNVFIMTGSPRKDGNSARLANAFAKGAQEHGHNVEFFHAAFRSFSGCRACDQCWTKGKACIMQDDWQEFSDKLEKADVVVFAYPMYWNTMPAQLKAAIDRLYSYCSPKALRSLNGKQTALLLCGECLGEEIFADALHGQDSMTRYFQWEEIGRVLVDGVFEAGKVEETDGLERAYQLGLRV